MTLKNNNLKSIVHIATDEKFIDTAYEIYEKTFPGRNQFIILTDDLNADIKYLSDLKNYHFVDVKNNLISKIENEIREKSIVVFHGLDFNQSLLANNIKKKDRKFLWSVFGFEVYNNPAIETGSIGKKTHKQFIFSYKRWIKKKLRPFFYTLFKSDLHPNHLRKLALKNMDYVTLLYDEELLKYKELDLVKEDIQFVKFTYYPVELVLDSDSQYVSSNKILLGNSASYTNNHLEAFEVLQEFDLSNNEIITVLSYGNEDYANSIIKTGKIKFKGSFKPLVEFLPLEEYQEILKKCGIVIMNHYRQQAVGNVLNALFLGAKVYLSNRNTLYHYLKRIGCHVFCIETELVKENEYAFALLDKNQMEENRAILKQELSLVNIVKELKTKLTPVIN